MGEFYPRNRRKRSELSTDFKIWLGLLAKPMSPKELIEETERSESAIHRNLRLLCEDEDLIGKKEGLYYAKMPKSERTKPLEGEVRAKLRSALEDLQSRYRVTTLDQISEAAMVPRSWKDPREDSDADFDQLAFDEAEGLDLKIGKKPEEITRAL